MSRPDILFQFSSTDASTDLTDGHVTFVAPEGGVSMINHILLCGSSGGAANVFRIYHAGPDETPSVSNMIMRAGVNSNAKNLTGHINDTKIIMNPGDQIFCQLHSGDGITITAYGIVPDTLTEIASLAVSDSTIASSSSGSGSLSAY